MTYEKTPCSVCGTPFAPDLTYQVEESSVVLENGEPSTKLTYFCSLDCVSRHNESQGKAPCDVCGTAFVVELVSQVVNHRGRRHHACSGECRRRLLEQLNGPSLRPVLVATPDVMQVPHSEAPAPLTASRAPSQKHAAARSADLGVPPRLSGDSGLPRQVAPPPTGSAGHPSSLPTKAVAAPAATSAAAAPTAVAIPLVSHAQRSSHARPSTAAPKSGPRAAAATPSIEATAEDVQWKRIQASMGGRTQVVAVFNHKGGTGKTTTAVTLAAGLASKGRKVLLVDTDGQGNVGVSLGMQTERTLYHVLVMGLDPREAIVEVRPNLHVLPSNETLAAAELFLAGRPNRDRVLSSRLSALREEYDVIIVDCSPSLSLLNQNALVFADGVLCPVACDYLSLVGIRQVLRTIKQVNRLLSHPVRLWGVLPTLYDARARVCVEAYDTLRQHFGDRCLSPIRMASRAKEAPSQAQTLFEYAPDATATKDYWQVVDQLYQDSDPSLAAVDLAAAGGVK